METSQDRNNVGLSEFLALTQSWADGDTPLQQTQAVGLTLVNWAKALNLLGMHPYRPPSMPYRNAQQVWPAAGSGSSSQSPTLSSRDPSPRGLRDQTVSLPFHRTSGQAVLDPILTAWL